MQTNLTLIVAGAPGLAAALAATGRFATVHDPRTTGDLRDLIGAGILSGSKEATVFLFADTIECTTPQTPIEVLVQKLTTTGWKVIIAGLSPVADTLVQQYPAAGMVQGPFTVNLVLGAISGLGLGLVEPLADGGVQIDPLVPTVAPASVAPAGWTTPNAPAGWTAPGSEQPHAPVPQAPAPQAPAPQAPAPQAPPPFAPPAPVAPEPAPWVAPAPAEPAPWVAPQPEAPVPPSAPAPEWAQPEPPAATPGSWAPPAGEPVIPAAPGPAAWDPPAPAPSAPPGWAAPEPAAPAGWAAPEPQAPGGWAQPAAEPTGWGAPEAPGGYAPPAPMGGPEAYQAQHAPQARRGYVITIAVPKGGAGKSSLTLNLSAYMGLRMREIGKNVCIIDTNFQQADIGKYLNSYNPNITSLVRNMGDITHERIGNHMLHRPDLNLSALLGPATPLDANPLWINARLYNQCLEVLRDLYDYILIDTPVAELFHDIFRDFALPQADYIVVPTAPNYPTIMNTDQWLRAVTMQKIAGGAGVDENRIGVVLNRAEDGIGCSEEEVRQELASWTFVGSIPETKEWKRANNEDEIVAVKNYAELNEAFARILYAATGEPLLASTGSTLAPTKGGKKGGLRGLLKR